MDETSRDRQSQGLVLRDSLHGVTTIATNFSAGGIFCSSESITRLRLYIIDRWSACVASFVSG